MRHGRTLRRVGIVVSTVIAASAIGVVPPHSETPAADVRAPVVSAGTGRVLQPGTGTGVAPVVEPLREVEAVTPPTGLPEVESTLYRGGREGLEVLTLGTLSGEVVARRVVRPPRATVPETRPLVALTFDDGPDPRYTPQVLAILRAFRVRATFCVVGVQARAHPKLVAAIARDGHVLCNHTHRHLERLNKQSVLRVRHEIEGAQRELRNITGSAPRFFRPPAGSLSPYVVGIARALGLRVLDWSIDPGDWRRPAAKEIVARILAERRPGAIVVLHDGGGARTQTLAALPHIIRGLRHRGYDFATP